MSGRIERPIVFFDVSCALCNGFVERILRSDREGQLLFAPLQGETAGELLPQLPRDPGAWSVVYLDERGVKSETGAALAICRRLGGWWRVAGLLRLVPRSWRDAVYRGIARRRRCWFGCTDPRRAPGGEGRFLP